MAGEALNARISVMKAGTPTRRRPTDAARESRRLASAIAGSLGLIVRSGRRRRRLTQHQLGSRVGVDQSRISQIELGRGGGVPLDLWVALGLALDQPFAASFSRPLDADRHPSDAGHLEMQEVLLALARGTGRAATFELPTRPADPTRSIDVCVRDARSRTLVIEEAWNTFGDLGAAVRSTHRKAAEAADIAATFDGGPPYRVATVWVVRDSEANRRLVGRYPSIFADAFPASSRAWVRSLTVGDAPPDFPGLVWFDPATRRLHEWRRGRR